MRRRGLRPASTRRSPLSSEQARGLSTARDWMTDSGGCGGVAGRLARRTRHRKRKARKRNSGIPASMAPHALWDVFCLTVGSLSPLISSSSCRTDACFVLP